MFKVVEQVLNPVLKLGSSSPPGFPRKASGEQAWHHLGRPSPRLTLNLQKLLGLDPAIYVLGSTLSDACSNIELLLTFISVFIKFK